MILAPVSLSQFKIIQMFKKKQKQKNNRGKKEHNFFFLKKRGTKSIFLAMKTDLEKVQLFKHSQKKMKIEMYDSTPP